jgi:predicted enzyme related to lactoylglutathione lyase
MTDPSCTILYVDDPSRSATFYSELLERKPVESSPTFAMFALANGTMFGLWARETVEPKTSVAGGGAEIAFTVPDARAVDQTHREWSGRGVPIVQQPTTMEFGRTFVGVDPDGHRLRVFAPPA